MTNRLKLLALVGGLVALSSAGQAQDKPAAPSPKSPRALYVVRTGDATTLAGVLGKHFQGEVAVSAVPAGSGTGLLLSGPATAEAVKLLGQLDRAPRTVTIEIALADITPKKGDDGKEPAADPDFTGPAAEAMAKLDALAKTGQVGSLRRIKITTVEGQPVASSTGGSRPITDAVAGGGGRPVQRSVHYRDIATTLKLTARVGADDAVAIDLTVNDSRLKSPEAGDEEGLTGFDADLLTTRVVVPAGRTVTAQAVRTNGKGGRKVAVVLVTARVVESGPVASAAPGGVR